MNEKVEDAKTHTFGRAYFVSDPYDQFGKPSELADSVVGVMKDGTGHAQHFRNVFKHTHGGMRVI